VIIDGRKAQINNEDGIIDKKKIGGIISVETCPAAISKIKTLTRSTIIDRIPIIKIQAVEFQVSLLICLLAFSVSLPCSNIRSIGL
jgi:hypothetical protein